jgi:hypothetical protein
VILWILSNSYERNRAQQYLFDDYIKLSNLPSLFSSHILYKDEQKHNTSKLQYHPELNIMKFTLPTLIALFTALPALALELPKPPPFTLSQDLSIEIVTPWPDAHITGDTVVTGDLVPVDDHMYHRLISIPLQKISSVTTVSFPLWRDSWKDHYLSVSLPRTIA